MDKGRRKELIEMYKNRKPEMRVISYRCKATGNVFLGISKETRADFNSNNFKLNAKLHPNKHLQELWNKYGADSFEMNVVKFLEYEEPGDDHTEELELLLEICLSEDPDAVKL